MATEKQEIKINEEFDFNKIKELYNNGMLKDHLDAKNYISKFLHPLTTGQHALVENNTITLISVETMRSVYYKRFGKDIKEWYETETIPKKLICDIHEPMIGDKFINMASQLKHKYQEYKTFDEKIKKAVNKMLVYIKEIWANNDENIYNYIINWFSNVVKGVKNQSCLYGKSIEGVGKSTLLDFFRDYVIGRDVFVKGKSDHLKGSHNMAMLGKLLVGFEELQIFSDKEWYAIDAELKDLITDNIASYTDKFEKRIQAENINNYIILSNFELKGVHGRRFCVLQFNTKYLNNFEFFKKLRDDCFNDKVGHAFYCYLKEIDTSNFKSNVIPETETKRELYKHLLPAHEKFLNKYFVSRKAGINLLKSELFKMYQESEFYKQDMTAFKFHAYLRELGFDSNNGFVKKLNGNEKYKIPYDKLLEFAKKRKWITENDEGDYDEDKPQSDLTIEQQILSLENQKYGIEQQILKLKQQLPITKEDFEINEIKEDKNYFKHNYFKSKSGEIKKIDNDIDIDNEYDIYFNIEDLENYTKFIDEIIKIDDIYEYIEFKKLQQKQDKINEKTYNHFNKCIKDIKPKKSKPITKVVKKGSAYVHENGKTYEIKENDDLEIDSDLEFD